MTPVELKRLFALNHKVLHVNVKGMTNEEALAQPQPAGNCLNWIVGHIVATRNALLASVGEPPIWPAEDTARYKRSSPPITRPDEGKPFDRILHDFDRSEERLQVALDRLTEGDLAKRPAGEESLGQSLAFFHFHEAYHVGQTGLLRRIAGKEGAIR